MKKILNTMHGHAYAVLRKCLILFTMLLTVELSARAEEFEVGDLRYKVLSETDRTVEVSGRIGEPTDVVIPESVENGGVTYSVTSIGNRAFHQCPSLASVTIPNSVTSIERKAFSSCTSLASITIPNSVNSIKWSAFERCTSLASVTIPSSVTSIGGGAFSYCSSLEEILADAGNANFRSDDGILYNKNMTELVVCPGAKKEVIIPNTVISIVGMAFYGCSALTSVTIPSSVTSIGVGTFYECMSLASVTIPNSVTSIGEEAFNRCTSLASVTIPSSVTSIGGGTFYECMSLASVTIPNSVTSIGEAAFSGCTSLASITIPNSVTSIGVSAFEGCTSLALVTIPNSVTSIGYGAFEGCMSLTSVTIPNSVTSIEGSALGGCTSLEEILVDAGNANYCSDNGILYNKNKTELIQCPGAKKEVTIPNTVTSIGRSAFEGCTSLASVIIPNSVTSIGGNAFVFCTSLASVTIPNSIKSIEWSVFYGCTSLKTIYSEPTTPPYAEEDTFSGVPEDAVIYVPEGTKEAYSQAEGWNYFTDFREMTSGVSELTVGNDAGPVDVYNMQGMLVKSNASQADVDALAPGLYIIGGRKVLVK